MVTQRDIDKAKSELRNKTLRTIQEETAYAWSARALGAFQLWKETGDMRMLHDALEYRHESLEHASLVGPQVYQLVFGYLSGLEQYI